MKQKELGQFYTKTNPFNKDLFWKWIKSIPDYKNIKFIEPFAGMNNIVEMIQDIGLTNEWYCYDIEPNNDDNIVKKYNIGYNDSILNFPKIDSNVVITNPPYLAKNSATKNKLNYNCNYTDLYQCALSNILNNVGYCAAIIPESFIRQNLFHDRLFGIISLTCVMFDNTDCPVCLALFSPISDDFILYRENMKLGTYNQLKSLLKEPISNINWKFNDPDGIIGLNAIDNTKMDSIEFKLGSEISPYKIKASSRSQSRISGLPDNIDLNEFLNKCNEILYIIRNDTYDIFLTSFKGLRKDNLYRRRLDFKMARYIMNLAVDELC